MSRRFMESVDSSTCEQLNRMLGVDATSQFADWSHEDFPAILEHQLAAPLEAELKEIDSHVDSKLAEWRRSSEHQLTRFSDLFAQPQPPVELLHIAKRFFKRARRSADGHLPEDVATALYFACIAIGMNRCGVRISQMSRKKLQDGFAWATNQPWVHTSIKDILRVAAASMDSGDSDSP